MGNADDFSEEARPLTFEATSLASDREVLTGEAPDE